MFFAFELYYRLVQVVDYKETQASVPSCHDIPRCVASKFTSFLCISPEHHHNAFPIYDRCYFLQPKDERQQSQRLWLGMYWRQGLLKSAAPRKTAPNGILDYFAASKSFSNRCFHRCPEHRSSKSEVVLGFFSFPIILRSRSHLRSRLPCGVRRGGPRVCA